MLKNKSLFQRFNKYRKEKAFQEKISKIKRYTLPNIKKSKENKEKVIYDLVPNSLGYSMNVTGKIGSGKATFVSAFIEFLINYIESVTCICLLFPTSDLNGWDKIRKNIIFVNNFSEIIDASNCIIVYDDMQVQLKGNKILIEMVLNKSYRNSEIMQCEQDTQIKDLVQKIKSNYFVLTGTFTLGDCQYFVEKILFSI